MLTKEENERLTRVGPGTPAGELLRRYWHPIAVAKELTDENPTKIVRLLCEDLVLFKDKQGRVGLLADHCSHRGASLLYGRVEERGIACAYHGWLYDCEGNILETPPERNEAIMNSVKHRAYPVQRHVGLYWAYMGPLPAPVIPKIDVWARKDGSRWVSVQPRLDCNWLQPMENSVDGPHAYILHQEFLRPRADRASSGSTTSGVTEGIAEWRYDAIPIGIMKTRIWKNGLSEGHPLIFPNMLRQADSTQIRVPIDDEHTWHIRVGFRPSEDGQVVDQADEDIPVTYEEPYKQPANALYPVGRFDTRLSIASQDFMAWETQGPIADRQREHLGDGDRGVVMYRRLLEREIAKVESGLDPMGVVRDPDHPIIDTGLQESLVHRGGRPTRRSE